MSPDVLVATVIGDIAVVVAASAVFGAVARRCGQPSVAGQILAGLALGPSLLGRLPGHLSARLFPPAALAALTVLAQIAVVIFMFGVGYELDRRSLGGRPRAVLAVAVFSLAAPMTLGAGAAAVFRNQFAPLGVAHVSHSLVLFMGVAMSITALPVLAAIVRERGLAGTTAGVTSTAAAGIMDVVAWLVLAAALVGSGPARPWPVTLGLLAGFVTVMLLVVRPVLGWWIRRPGAVLANQVPAAIILALASAWVTASLGLHPVFGGFLAGLAMPSADGAPDPAVLRPVDEVSGLLLPLFFVVTGLSVNIGALSPGAFALLGVACLIASLGKLAPAYLGARVGGLSGNDAATVAVLVNARGLTELIALNVGLSAGLITRQLFGVLVLMALIMTMMTAPLLTLTRRSAARQAPAVVRNDQEEESAVSSNHRM